MGQYNNKGRRRVPAPIGERFNHLTVISDAPDTSKGDYDIRTCFAKCDCGSIRRYRMGALILGRILACGCKLSYKTKLDPMPEPYQRTPSTMRQVKLSNIWLIEYGLTERKISSTWISILKLRTHQFLKHL